MSKHFTLDNIVNICSKSILFKYIEKETLESLLSLLKYQVIFIKKDELIISEDDYIDYMGIILQGKINTCKYYSNGMESIMSELMSHELLGVDILCTPSKKSYYNAYATEDSYVLKIETDLIHMDVGIDEKNRIIILKNIIHCLANENAKKCRKIEITSQKTTRAKIMNYLLIQQQNNKSNKFKISFDRDQLASFLCINRSVLSHELSMMQNQGLIKFKKNDFEILERNL